MINADNIELVKNFFELGRKDEVKQLVAEFSSLYKEISNNYLKALEKIKVSNDIIKVNVDEIISHTFVFEDVLTLIFVEDFTSFSEVYEVINTFILNKTAREIIGDTDAIINFIKVINGKLADIKYKTNKNIYNDIYIFNASNFSMVPTHSNYLKNLLNSTEYIEYFLFKDIVVTRKFIRGMCRLNYDKDFKDSYIKIVDKIYVNNLKASNIVNDYISLMIIKYCEEIDNKFTINFLHDIEYAFKKYNFNHAKLLGDFEKIDGGWQIIIKALSELGRKNKNNYKSMELDYDNFIKNYDDHMPLEWNMELYPIELKEIVK